MMFGLHLRPIEPSDDELDILMDDVETEEELMAQESNLMLTFEDAFEYMLDMTENAHAANSSEPYQWKDIKGRPDAHQWEQAATEEC